MRPTIKHKKKALIQRITSMPVPGVIELTQEDWRPSDPWLRKITGVDLSVRRPNDKFYIFRIG